MKRVPPYIPFRTFNNFLEGLRDTGIPTRIDRSVLAHRSGSIKSQLLSSLFFLGLISENGLPGPDLKLLVQSAGRKREEVWQSILHRAYPSLFALNIERTTTEQVQIVLAKEGLKSAETIRKALNFFCLAAKESGLKLSSHIKPYAGRRQSHKKAREIETQQDFASIQPGFVATAGNGSSENEALLSKFPKFDPSWPPDYIKNWIEAYSQLRKLFREESPGEEPSSIR